jgi:AmpD protein
MNVRFFMIDNQGFYTKASQFPCCFFNERPESAVINLLVIHCISLPEGVYGGKQIQQLFMGQLNCEQHPSFGDLCGLEVSAHCVIYRDGSVAQYVPFEKRAWHAGRSAFDGVENCNDYSIGIELEGTIVDDYTPAQYDALIELTKNIQLQYPDITLKRIVGHSDIASNRKQDPGQGFDWHYFKKQL